MAPSCIGTPLIGGPHPPKDINFQAQPTWETMFLNEKFKK